MKNNQRHIKNSNYRDVVLIKGHDRLGGGGGGGGKWNIGIVEELYEGKDNVI